MRRWKSIIAILAVICILATVIAFFVSAVTGNRYFMGYLYLAWLVPVLLWVFSRIADILEKYGPAARDSYEVVRIEEPDFGCEGREEGKPVLCKVVLRHRRSGEETVTEASEQNLDEEQILEGDYVKRIKGVLLKHGK